MFLQTALLVSFIGWSALAFTLLAVALYFANWLIGTGGRLKVKDAVEDLWLHLDDLDSYELLVRQAVGVIVSRIAAIRRKWLVFSAVLFVFYLLNMFTYTLDRTGIIGAGESMSFWQLADAFIDNAFGPKALVGMLTTFYAAISLIATV